MLWAVLLLRRPDVCARWLRWKSHHSRLLMLTKQICAESGLRVKIAEVARVNRQAGHIGLIRLINVHISAHIYGYLVRGRSRIQTGHIGLIKLKSVHFTAHTYGYGYLVRGRSRRQTVHIGLIRLKRLYESIRARGTTTDDKRGGSIRFNGACRVEEQNNPEDCKAIVRRFALTSNWPLCGSRTAALEAIGMSLRLQSRRHTHVLGSMTRCVEEVIRL